VILIDELAALSYVNERDRRRRIDNALGLLLSQGRAVGVTVIGAIQDPRKETPPAHVLASLRAAPPKWGRIAWCLTCFDCPPVPWSVERLSYR
jgi:hypothetical protein